MLAGKRKQGFSGLQRRVRPRKEAEPEIDENLSSEPEQDEGDEDELTEGEDDDQMDEDEDDEEVKPLFHPPIHLYHINIKSARITAAKEAQLRHLISLLWRSRQGAGLHATGEAAQTRRGRRALG